MGLLSDFRQWDDEVATPWLKEKATAVDDWAYNHVPGYAPLVQPWARDGWGGLLQQTDSALHGRGFSPQAVSQAVMEMAPGNALVGAGAVRNVSGPVLGTFVGRDGMMNLFGKGQADELVAKADGLLQMGATPEQVKISTNMHKGMDDIWKYEIDDSKAELISENLIPPAEKARRADAPEMVSNREVDYGDYEVPMWLALEHPELYKAHPELKKVTVVPDRLTEAEGWSGSDIIGLSPRAQDPMGTMLHETQHIIQNKEGFAKGGSPESFSNEFVREERARIKQAAMDSVGAKDPEIYDAFVEKEKLRESLMSKYGGGFGWEAPQADLDRLGKLESLVSGSTIGRQLENIKGHVESTAKQRFDLYERLAGEIEARDVSDRRFLDEKGRREKTPRRSDFAILEPQ